MSTHLDASKNRPQEQNSDVFALLDPEDRAAIWDRLLAKNAAKPPDGSEYVSPDLFNAQVTPDLEAVVRGYGCLVRSGVSSWTEALDHSFAYAWRRGGFGFNAEHLADLQDWISHELVRAIGPEY